MKNIITDNNVKTNNNIITDKTIALLKKGSQTIIYNVNNLQVINKSLGRILKDNCLFYGSTLNGRLISAKKILNIKYKLPIYINENIILLRIGSFREEGCLLINFNKIVDYEINRKFLKIICVTNQVFNVKISLYCFEKMLINYFKLNNRLKWRNCVK